MNHTRNTIWHRITRVCMGYSTRYPWRYLKGKISNKNDLPYSRLRAVSFFFLQLATRVRERHAAMPLDGETRATAREEK